MNWVLVVQIVGWALLALVVLYFVLKFYQTQADFTYMTHNDRGFKRALRGRGFIIDPEEFVVKGPSAPKIEFVAHDPSTGQRKLQPLLDPNTGRVNLRPQYCVPLPFTATTEEGHQILCTARVQFSLNREKLFFVYHVQDFATALETRIHKTIRAEVGRRTDEKLRAGLQDVEDGALKTLRQAEDDGDEEHEMGIALGVKFHDVAFDFAKNARGLPPGAMGADGQVVVDGKAAPMSVGGVLQSTPGSRVGALSIDPLDIDAIADQFNENRRSASSAAAYLALAEMQTRQNIAEALAASGQLIVMTPQELGMFGVAAQREAMARRGAQGPSPSPNGSAHPGEQRP